MIRPNAKHMLGTFTYMKKFKKGRGQTKTEKEAEVHPKLLQLEYMTGSKLSKVNLRSHFQSLCQGWGVYLLKLLPPKTYG